jgi:murein DD-endopeptidase MepM/ murein hydrolase activator NlpD
MGGLTRPAQGHSARRAGVALLLALLLAMASGTGGISCASRGQGVYHKVQKGETLYRLGQQYGVPAEKIRRANRVRNVKTLQIGTRLWIPGARASRTLARRSAGGHSQTRGRSVERSSGGRAQLSAGKLTFAWPVRGATVTSHFGPRYGRPHEGVDLGVRSGTSIRAAESGKVIHSGWLGDYGKVVIVKHTGTYRSVYAHARTVKVRKGQFVKKGQQIAEVGSTGRSTGPHLHFEIRKREVPRDPLLYLP